MTEDFGDGRETCIFVFLAIFEQQKPEMGDLPDEQEIGDNDDAGVEYCPSGCRPTDHCRDGANKRTGDNGKRCDLFEIGVNDVVPEDVEEA